MTASQQIVQQVEALGTDRVFSIADLDFPIEWWENIRVKLNRMAKENILIKIAPGKFFRPRISVFGSVPPTTEELVKDMLYKDGKRLGYLTGYSIWDSMGLTTQFSSTIFIGLNRRKDPVTRGDRKIRFILQPNEITEENVALLQILDAIKLIKKIPDAPMAKSVERLKEIVKALNEEKIKQIIDLALNYPPHVRALTGAIIDAVRSAITTKLKASLNPLTEYRMGIGASELSTVSTWNIK